MTKQTHFYLRDRNGHPIGVVAMRKEDDGVRVAASLCATTDEWDKHVGVAKAVGRLESDGKYTRLLKDNTVKPMRMLHWLLSPEQTQNIRDWLPCDRLRDVDEQRLVPTWDAQYERLTTPRPA